MPLSFSTEKPGSYFGMIAFFVLSSFSFFWAVDTEMRIELMGCE